MDNLVLKMQLDFMDWWFSYVILNYVDKNIRYFLINLTLKMRYKCVKSMSKIYKILLKIYCKKLLI